MTPQHRPDATADLTAALRERVLVLDGAMGTMIQGHGLSEADYRGERFADHPSDVMGNNDLLSMTQPAIIGGIHRAYLEAGADLINDAWGGADPALVEVAAEYDVGLVCTHTGGATPRTRPHRVEYADVVASALADTTAYAARAAAAGVARESILIDPAHDFGKTTRDSLDLTRRLDELVATGWPVLVSLSNKDFVGETLDLPVGERLTGTLAATAVCALAGARIYRVHEVVETRQTVDMVSTIAGRRPPARAIRGLQ